MMANIFVYATETAYGLGCDARDAAAVAKIFEIKGRAVDKSVPLIAASSEMVAQFCDSAVWNHPEVQRVVAKYWPGALTLVLPINDFGRSVLAPQVVRDNTIAIRVSGNEHARALSQKCGAPIVATSANASGQPTCYTVADVRLSLTKASAQPDDFFDNGPLTPRAPSTIVQFENGVWNILRQGEIYAE